MRPPQVGRILLSFFVTGLVNQWFDYSVPFSSFCREPFPIPSRDSWTSVTRPSLCHQTRLGVHLLASRARYDTPLMPPVMAYSTGFAFRSDAQ